MNIVKVRGTQAPLSRFHDAFDDLLGRFFGDWPLSVTAEMWAPALDVCENDDEIIVKAELPGVKSDDIEVSVQGNTLYLSGEKKEEKEESHDNYRHVERRYGRFSRAIPLPGNVNADKIKARNVDGVLSITLPKLESAKPKRIPVQTK